MMPLFLSFKKTVLLFFCSALVSCDSPEGVQDKKKIKQHSIKNSSYDQKGIYEQTQFKIDTCADILEQIESIKGVVDKGNIYSDLLSSSKNVYSDFLRKKKDGITISTKSHLFQDSVIFHVLTIKLNNGTVLDN